MAILLNDLNAPNATSSTVGLNRSATIALTTALMLVPCRFASFSSMVHNSGSKPMLLGTFATHFRNC